MKQVFPRFLALFLIVLTVSLPLSASADVELLSVPAYYMTWVESIYGEEVDREIRSSRNTKDETVVSADKITTYSDLSTFGPSRISFLYLDTNVYYTYEMYQTANNKAKAFFCGIEAGNPLKLTRQEIIDWDRKAEAFLINQVYGYGGADEAAVKSGDYYPFYESENGDYYFRFEFNSRLMIYFSPKGREPLAPKKKEPAVNLAEILRIQDEWTTKFAWEAKSRAKEYYDVTLDDLTLTLNAETGHAQAVNVRFTWKAKNDRDMTKKMLELFSDDLAAYLHEQYPELVIDQLTIFWTVPYHSKTGYAAKYQYASQGKEMLRLKELGLLYGTD